MKGELNTKECVLGTGAMATGIIQVMAQNGHDVIVRGRSQEKADGAVANAEGIDTAMRLGRKTGEGFFKY